VGRDWEQIMGEHSATRKSTQKMGGEKGREVASRERAGPDPERKKEGRGESVCLGLTKTGEGSQTSKNG